MIKKELFILQIYTHLLKRDYKKYFKVASASYFLGLLRISPAAKPAYFFCRLIDDIADGEADLPSDVNSFQALIEALKSAINNGKNNHSLKLELILIDAIAKLEKSGADKDLVQNEFCRFLDAMYYDFQRRTNQLTLTQDEILDVYEKSFGSVLHLATLGLQIAIPERCIKLLGLLQGRIYALQDIKEEFPRGIYNVPQEVLEQVFNNSEMAKSKAVDRLITTEAYHIWKKNEIETCANYSQKLRDAQLGKKGQKLVRFLLKPIDEYISHQLAIVARPSSHTGILANPS